MMKPRGHRVAGGSAGCTEGHLLRSGFPQRWRERRYGRDPESARSTFGGSRRGRSLGSSGESLGR